MKKLIYIADDDKNIRNLIKAFLETEGYEVRAYESGDLLFEAFKGKECDLVVLDIMMPGSSGLIICKKLRELSNVPIIMLTAKDTEDDYIIGLSLGSDDYLTKPFSPAKLTMRVKAMLRRVDMHTKMAKNGSNITYGNITVNPGKMTAYCGSNALKLTKTEFNLLMYLLENKEKAVSRQELLNSIWGYESGVESRATDDAVKRLRRKLENAESDIFIDTVWGHGFRIALKEGAKP